MPFARSTTSRRLTRTFAISAWSLTRSEVDLKAKAMKLMKQHGKTTYKHNGIAIELIAGEEEIKVRVKKPVEDDGTDPQDGPDVQLSEDADHDQSLADA